MRFVAAVIAFTIGVVAPAAAEYEKLCIFAAAQKVPRIPGLIVTGGRTSDVPKQAAQLAKPSTSGGTVMMVEIDVKAVGQDATFSFVCTAGPGKPTFIEPVGVK